jgi:hypothetical protein
MNTARSYFGAVAYNNRIYVFGGFNGSYLNSVEEYNPLTNVWARKSATGTIPPGLRSFSATLVPGGKI